MKKAILAFAVLTALLASCTKENSGIKSIKFNPESYSIYVGQEIAPDYTVNPSDADRTMINWTSDNPEVATVTSGFVTAVGPGTATITASSGRASAKLGITVTDVDVTSFYVSSSVSVGVNSTALVPVSDFEPSYGTVSHLEYSIDESKYEGKHFYVAGVDKANNAIIVGSRETATNGMTAELRISNRDGSLVKTVTVKCEYVPITSLEFGKSTYYARVEDEINMYVSPSPRENTASRSDLESFEWTLSDESVISLGDPQIVVYQTGSEPYRVATALKEGTCKVTVKDNKSGCTASCNVIVYKKVTFGPGDKFWLYKNYDSSTNLLSAAFVDNPSFTFLPVVGQDLYIGTSTADKKTLYEKDFEGDFRLSTSGNIEADLHKYPLSIHVYSRMGSGSVTVTAPNDYSQTVSVTGQVSSISMCTWETSRSYSTADDPHFRSGVTTLPATAANFNVSLPGSGKYRYIRFALNSGSSIYLNNPDYDNTPFRDIDGSRQYSSDAYAYYDVDKPDDIELDLWAYKLTSSTKKKTYNFSIPELNISWTLTVN